MADFKEILNTPDTTAEYEAKDIDEHKVISLFSYIGPLFLIPLFAAKDSKYARFHVNQGLILFIVEVALAIASSVLGAIPFVGWLLALPFWLADIVVTVLAVLGIINAVTGKAKELPIIGKFKIIK